AVVEVALDAATLGIGGGHDAGSGPLEILGLMAHLLEGGLKKGVELNVVHGQLCALILDDTPLKEIRADAALDGVASDRANDDGGEEEEVVVDQDFDLRGLQPESHELVTGHEGDARSR